MAEQDISKYTHPDAKYTHPDAKIRIMVQDPNKPKSQPVSKEKPTVASSAECKHGVVTNSRRGTPARL